MNTSLLAATLLLGCAGLLRSADTPPSLYFEKVEPKALTTLSLHFDENGKVYGNHHWIPTEMDGAHGYLDGTIKGDIVRVVYNYTIEGSEQSEEQVYKIEGNKLIRGEGESREVSAGKVVFVKNAKFTFPGDNVLKKVTVLEPKPGDPERKAIMDALRGPVSKHIGKPVQFVGNLRIKGDWARLAGGAQTLDGKPPANENAAGELELDLQAFLHKNAEGVWKPVHWGFAGDVSVIEDAREKCEGASWVLFD
ncbi:MAG: hypothetical protein ACO1TE_12525 [Prosthecobacter sp.]